MAVKRAQWDIIVKMMSNVFVKGQRIPNLLLRIANRVLNTHMRTKHIPDAHRAILVRLWKMAKGYV